MKQQERKLEKEGTELKQVQLDVKNQNVSNKAARNIFKDGIKDNKNMIAKVDRVIIEHDLSDENKANKNVILQDLNGDNETNRDIAQDSNDDNNDNNNFFAQDLNDDKNVIAQDLNDANRDVIPHYFNEANKNINAAQDFMDAEEQTSTITSDLNGNNIEVKFSNAQNQKKNEKDLLPFRKILT